MKKQSLLTILLGVFFPIFLHAQNNPGKPPHPPKALEVTVVYRTFDYLSDKEQVYQDRVKIGSRVGMKIINVNKKLVDITESVSQTSFNETEPDLLKSFSQSKVPDAAAGGAGMSSDQKELVDEAALIPTTIPATLKNNLSELGKENAALAEKIEDLIRLLRAYGENYSRIKWTLIYHQNLLALQEVCNTSFTTIVDEVNKQTVAAFTDAKMDVDQAARAQLLTKSSFLSNRAIMNAYLEDRLSKLADQGDLISAALMPSSLAAIANDVKTVSAKIKTAQAAVKTLKAKDKNTNEFIKSFEDNIAGSPLEKKLADLEKVISTINFEKLRANVEAFAVTGKKDLFTAYDYFNESNYTYYINPQTVEKDLMIMTADIKPKANITCAPYARSYEIRVRPKGGVKFDFSTGLFVNFGGNNFRDQSYRYDTVPGSPANSVIRKNDPKSAVFPSIGALLHVYPRTGKEFNWAGCFGISTKDAEKINYHLGTSLIFGYSQRFVLSAGATMTRATLIADQYKVDQQVITATAPQDIPTSTFNRFGWFFAFSYNVTAK